MSIAREHFTLTYRDNERPAARLGRDRRGQFVVEIVGTSSADRDAIDAVTRELDFYLHDLGERDPWAYARYHCATAANVYSNVHWAFRDGAIRVTATVLAGETRKVLEDLKITPWAVAAVQRRLHAAHGHEEEVIEAFLRCSLSHHLQNRYAIAEHDMPSVINSSHARPAGFCAARNSHRHLGWSKRHWQRFREEHPEVDRYQRGTDGKRHLRRADLFIVASDGLLSIEFKYIRGKTSARVDDCVGQMRRYRRHAASLLVVYSAIDDPSEVRELERRIRGGLPANASVTTLSGPPVVMQPSHRHKGR